MKLYEQITTENWIKGAFGDALANCLVGHIHRRAPWAAQPVYNAIRLLYPRRARPVDDGEEPYPAIAEFNDHPDTAIDDVIRVCKVADV